MNQIKEPDLSEGEPVAGAVVLREQTAVTQSEGAQIRSAILQLARDPNFDVEKLRVLTDLQIGVEDRQAERLFIAAFTRMQAKIPTVKRDGSLEYPIHKDQPDGPKRLISKYARWEDIEKAIQPILASEGFALSFRVATRGEGGGLLVSTVLRHEAGHVETGDPFPVPLDTSGGKNNIQAYGSALSYGQRYSAKTAGLIRTEGEDDDGVAAGGEDVTRDQAARLVQLVEEAGIASGNTEDERKANRKKWFAENLSYEIDHFTKVRKEDYARLARLLKSLGDNRKEAEAAKVAV